ncbi:YkgJ family cysteine cluster protein [Methylomicrobium lacus]|uniref:YkgJ family cysteine cluster protein n=1 Tax=Methylomicrobium lacus TaxID=136992 RepID=UPI0035A90AB8
MQCRIGCGACCIAPSISSAIPLHPFGKPAGMRCLHLDVQNKCSIFLHPSRPLVCRGFQATEDSCGSSAEEAMAILSEWENLTGSP